MWSRQSARMTFSPQYLLGGEVTASQSAGADTEVLELEDENGDDEDEGISVTEATREEESLLN